MRIGVVIPAYEVAGFVGDAVRSLLRQTRPDWRCVVVDDGSADGTFLAACEAAAGDRRITVLSQANAGVSAARNAGRALLAGVDAFLFLDADDWLEPDALARLAAALWRGGGRHTVASVGDYAFVPEAATPEVPGTPGEIDARRARAGDVARRIHVGNIFANGGHLLIRASAMPDAFPVGLAFGEDWVAWAALALRGRVTRAPGVTLYVRRRAGGAMGRWAADPGRYAASIEAVFANPAVTARFGQRGARKLRARAFAEADWISGRASLAQGFGAGHVLLRRSVRAAPTVKRLVALAVLSARTPPPSSDCGGSVG